MEIFDWNSDQAFVLLSVCDKHEDNSEFQILSAISSVLSLRKKPRYYIFRSVNISICISIVIFFWIQKEFNNITKETNISVSVFVSNETYPRPD